MATLGKPSIPTPRDLTLLAVQQGFDRVRERFVAVESAVNGLGGSTQSQLASTVQAQSQQLAALANQINVIAAAVRALSTASPSTETAVQLILMEIEGPAGEDGMTIPGPAGPQGLPGPALFIAGEDGEDGISILQ